MMRNVRPATNKFQNSNNKSQTNFKLQFLNDQNQTLVSSVEPFV